MAGREEEEVVKAMGRAGCMKTACCFCKRQSVNRFPLIAAIAVALVRWEQAHGCLLMLSSHLGFVWRHTGRVWGSHAVVG